MMATNLYFNQIIITIISLSHIHYILNMDYILVFNVTQKNKHNHTQTPTFNT